MTGQPLPVGQLADYLRGVLALDPVLGDAWVTGEVVDARRPASGHLYFTLADAEAALRCVTFRGALLRQTTVPRNGMQVTVHGGFDLYPRTGEVQLIVDSIQPAGLGLAALELERLRQRLAAEGLFDEARKRPLPAAPRCVGVVTSPTGAVWQDIQQIVRRRYPLTHLILSPARVQGDGAAASLVEAIEALCRDGRAEVIIVARGGGSAEDLAPFNAEAVVRAVFACPVPVVSGVGHETDVTLIDFVADLRAPTPSAAAELCVPAVAALLDRVDGLSDRLERAFEAIDGDRRRRFDQLRGRLRRTAPRRALGERRADVQTRAAALRGEQQRRQGERARQVAGCRHLLRALEPRAVLGRGYALLSDAATGRPVARAGEAWPGQAVVATLADGTLDVGVRRVVAETGQAARG